MALLTITMHPDEESGRPLIRIALCSDRDTLPHEHESHHRRLLAQLFPSAGEVQRERPAREAGVG